MSEAREPSATADDGDEFEIEEDATAGSEGADDAAEGEDSGGGIDPAADTGAVEPEDPGRPAQPDGRQGPARRVRRSANEEIRELRARSQRAEEQTALFQRQLAEVLQQRQSADEQARQAAEQQRLQFMSPEERADYRVQQAEERINNRLRAVQVNIWDQADRATYERELGDRPNLRRFETRVDELHRLYPTVSRVDLLDKAIGEAFRKNEKGLRTRVSNGNANADRQQRVSAPAARNSVPVEQNRQGASLEERLRGKLI